MPPTDHRSVGELLGEADRMSRQLLWDVSGADAAPLVRTWGEVVEAASDLWAAIPGRSAAGYGADPMARLDALAHAMHRSRLAGGWPGDGPTDERAVVIAEMLIRAANLVTRHGQEVPMRRPDVRADAEAARRQTMHILFTGAHAVGVALHQFGRDERRAVCDGARPRPLHPTAHPYALGRTARWVRRFETQERHASAYLHAPGHRDSAVQATTEPWQRDRLAHALAGWEVNAHRAMSGRPWAADVLMVCRTQAVIATGSLVLLDAARATGHLAADAGNVEKGLTALETMQSTWVQLGTRWADLVSPGSRTEATVVHAAGEFRAALQDAAHGQQGWLPACAIADRIDLLGAVNAVQDALSSAVEMALTVGRLSASPGLQGPARPLSTRAHADAEIEVEAGLRASEDVVWVAPRDVQRNCAVALPEPVQQNLITAARRTYDASEAAANILSPLSTSGAAAPTDRTAVEETGAGLRPPHRGARVAPIAIAL